MVSRIRWIKLGVLNQYFLICNEHYLKDSLNKHDPVSQLFKITVLHFLALKVLLLLVYME